tara:strand:+ start:14871 stop:15278 length:408 start_codon:yes stop_codon:yes gene_type:complete
MEPLDSGVPLEFAAVDASVANLSDAWANGVKSVPVLLRVCKGVCESSTDAINLALENKDWPAVRSEAHSFAGLLAYVYAHSAVWAFREVERSVTGSSNINESSIIVNVQHACRELQRVQAALFSLVLFHAKSPML